MHIRFDGKSVLVTGASTGIGAATALAFGAAGAAVAVNYLNSAEAAGRVVETIEAKKGRAIAVRADVSRAEEVRRLVDSAVEQFGAIDILVNNAGSLIQRSSLLELEEEVWDRVMALNIKSVYLCTRTVLPLMAARSNGNIVNVTSIAARSGGGPGAGHYAAAKAAVATLTRNLAREFAGSGIRINAVAPGVIATPFHDRFSPPEVRQGFLRTIPLKREGTPEEVAHAILFLASEFASYIIGETIEINGGMLMD